MRTRTNNERDLFLLPSHIYQKRNHCAVRCLIAITLTNFSHLNNFEIKPAVILSETRFTIIMRCIGRG